MTLNCGLISQTSQGRTFSRRAALLAMGSGVLAVALASEETGAQATPASCPTSTALTSNKDLVRRMFEETFNAHDPAAVDQFMAPNYVEHHVPAGVPPTRDSLKQDLAQVFAASPDAQMTFEAMCAEGDMVWVRDIWRGTFRGSYYGQRPTGKPVSQEAVDIFRIANGQIVEHWAISDDLGLLRQLGLLPSRPPVASPAATPAR